MVNVRSGKSVLKFEAPASWWGGLWREALPTGNGRIGAAVYGGAGSETVMINHADLSWQGHVSVLPDVADKLKEVRDRLDEGKPRVAQDIYQKAMISKNYRPVPASPLPLVDFNIKTALEKAPREYMRMLNMASGEVSVTYKDGATKFDRSVFVSRDNDTVVFEINKSGLKTVDAEFSLDLHDKTYARTPVSASRLPEGVMTKYEPYFMYFSAQSDNGTEFGAVGKIQFYGGSQEVTQKSIKIKGASSVLVIIKLFIESQREKEWKRLRAELAAVKENYDKMLKVHTQAHARLFNSMEFDLDAADRDASAESLIRRAHDGDLPPALIEKLWQFARYLAVCATDPAGRPLNSYGLWCGDYKASDAQLSVDSGFHAAYAHALSGNLSELVSPLFTYYENAMDDLKKNAGRLFGARGIFVPLVNSPGTGLPGSSDPSATFFTAGAAIVANLFYNYYLYNDDTKFLKARALPFMKEAALFYEDFFKLGHDGYYVSSPSYSPFTNPGNYAAEGEDAPLCVAANATVDFAAVKELLTNLVSAAENSGAFKNEADKWRDMLTKIPPYELNADKAVKEYLTAKFTDNYVSEKIPHLYAAYPGNEINAFTADAELVKGFITAAKKRVTAGLREQTAASLGAAGSLFARLGDADGALDCLGLAVRGCVMNNLVTAENDWRGMGISAERGWAQYHIQGNLILANLLQDMLAASTDKSLKILPSFPAEWERFSVSGLQTRAGVTADMTYKNGNLTLTLKAKRAVKVDLYFPSGTKRVAKGPNAESFNAETLCVKGAELSSKPVTYDIKYTPARR